MRNGTAPRMKIEPFLPYGCRSKHVRPEWRVEGMPHFFGADLLGLI
jgi:hypothetical protein